jgi:hypothetical protein
MRMVLAALLDVAGRGALTGQEAGDEEART